MTRNHSAQDLDFEPEDAVERLGPDPLDWAFFLLRAPKRRKLLFAAVLVMGCAAVFAYYALKPRTYRVEARILAQQHQVLPSGFRASGEDNPARTAWEVIHRRDNVLALIKNANLLHESSKEEEPGGLLARLGLAKEPGDPLDDMVALIDKLLLVTTDDGTITVSLDWYDPQQAYAIVDGALQNFIEARHVQEVTAIDEVLSVLRVREAKARDQLERVTEDVRREALEGPREPQPQRVAVAAAPRGASDEVIRLKSLLESKERSIADVEEFRRRRLTDLHAQLDEKRTTFSEAHPSIIQLRQDIDALSKESPQVVALQAEAAKLRSEYEGRLARESALSGGGGAPVALPRGAPRPRSATPPPVEDDERVRDARIQYQQIVERVNAAQIELDAVRAAFKYRYNVVWPPQIPREPYSPKPGKILGIGFLASLVFAFLCAALPDLKSGRIVERWQVERGLGITVLAEIEKK